MKTYLGIAGAAMALAIAACGSETAASGSDAAIDAEADTSRNWTEVISKTEEGGIRMGKPDAPIEIIEYASLTCSHCAEFSEAGFEPLSREYVSQGLASYEIRNFVRDPLDLTAALLSRCNGAEPYFTLTERMFANQTQFFDSWGQADQQALQAVATPENMQNGEALSAFANAAGMIDFVGSMGIPEARARQCLADQSAVQELDQMRNRAISQYNIPGTPMIIINGEVAQGMTTWAQLEARLKELVE